MSDHEDVVYLLENAQFLMENEHDMEVLLDRCHAEIVRLRQLVEKGKLNDCEV